MADYLKRELISHTRRVCSLYKRMMRDIDFWEADFYEGRYRKLLLRQQFDNKKGIKDIRQAKVLLDQAEAQFKQDIHPYHAHSTPYHAYSKEGIAYERNLLSPDYVMDWHHPLEKAQYPYYFAKREAMKEEYLKMWKKKMMKPGQEPHTDVHH